MAAACRRRAMRAVAATHDWCAVAAWRMAAVIIDAVHGGAWIVRVGAAGIEVDLGLGGAHGAKRQCKGKQ